MIVEFGSFLLLAMIAKWLFSNSNSQLMDLIVMVMCGSASHMMNGLMGDNGSMGD
jgi:hypothetical protein